MKGSYGADGRTDLSDEYPGFWLGLGVCWVEDVDCVCCVGDLGIWMFCD